MLGGHDGEAIAVHGHGPAVEIHLDPRSRLGAADGEIFNDGSGDRLAVRDPTLDAAGAVGRGRHVVVGIGDVGVVMLSAGEEGAGEAAADFEAFAGGEAEDGFAEVGAHPPGSAVKLSRFAWLSIAAACLTIGLKAGAYLVTGSVGLLSDALDGAAAVLGSVLAGVV